MTYYDEDDKEFGDKEGLLVVPVPLLPKTSAQLFLSVFAGDDEYGLFFMLFSS